MMLILATFAIGAREIGDPSVQGRRVLPERFDVSAPRAACARRVRTRRFDHADQARDHQRSLSDLEELGLERLRGHGSTVGRGR
jgi:hypothetical protein